MEHQPDSQDDAPRTAFEDLASEQQMTPSREDETTSRFVTTLGDKDYTDFDSDDA
jgi:hypothetical protein